MKYIGIRFAVMVVLLANFSQAQNCNVQITGTPENCGMICNGSATASPFGQAPFSYSWQPGNLTTQQIANLCPGTYTLTVTDSTGCIAIDSVEISTIPILTATISASALLCFGDSTATLEANISGGLVPFSVIWNPGPYYGDSVANVPAGSYTATITDSLGCVYSDTVSVTSPPPLNVWFAGATPPSCANCSDGVIYGAVSGGVPPYCYAWSAGSVVIDQTNVTVGTYILCVCDANDCWSCADTVLTFPTGIDMAQSKTEIEYVEVYDLCGRIVWTGRYERTQFSQSTLNGTYIIVYKNSNNIEISRELRFFGGH
jgi:hypothetical protein